MCLYGISPQIPPHYEGGARKSTPRNPLPYKFDSCVWVISTRHKTTINTPRKPHPYKFYLGVGKQPH